MGPDPLLPSWLHDANVQLPKLFLGHRGRRVHQQILGVLGHRKRNHLAQVGLLRQQHHDPVDSRSQTPVRRRAAAECPEHTAIAPLESSTPLHTMSYWNALIDNGSLPFSASSPPCGIENGL